MNETRSVTTAQWLVLAAAFLGWMFDGVEIGLFPLVVRPALQDLGLADESTIAWWNSVVLACFLLGAASGGIVFGWLGDKIGRVRSMVMSVLAYSLFTGACYFATAPWQLGVFRFAASMGMGGEWALAVALVMECWPEKHRPKLAGAIGAAANFGFLLIALVALGKPVTRESWRWIMLVAASPALLAVFISLFVPESERWKESVKSRLAAGRAEDLPRMRRTAFLSGVFLAIVGIGLLLFWMLRVGRLAPPSSELWKSTGLQWLARLGAAALVVWVFYCGSVVARRPAWFVGTVLLGALAALVLWLGTEDYRLGLLPAAFAAGSIGAPGSVRELFSPGLRRSTFFAVVFSAVPLIGTWAAVSGWIPVWVDQMTQIEAGKRYLDPRQLAQFENAQDPKAKIEVLKNALSEDQWKLVRATTGRSKAWVQLALAIGAIIACFIAPVLGGIWGRRPVYFGLCLVSLLSCAYLFRYLDTFNAWFIVVVWFVGGATASFYGWLPLYLPELFPTRVRATGQGLSFNFGRVLTAIGVFYMGYLVAAFGGDYGRAMAAITLIYVLGMVLIWLAPETKGKPLPE